jgi:hypothetical protein
VFELGVYRQVTDSWMKMSGRRFYVLVLLSAAGSARDKNSSKAGVEHAGERRSPRAASRLDGDGKLKHTLPVRLTEMSKHWKKVSNGKFLLT